MVFTASRAACALTFGLAIVTAPAALAHAHLKHQYPAADAEVVAAPQHVKRKRFRKRGRVTPFFPTPQGIRRPAWG